MMMMDFESQDLVDFLFNFFFVEFQILIFSFYLVIFGVREYGCVLCGDICLFRIYYYLVKDEKLGLEGLRGLFKVKE